MAQTIINYITCILILGVIVMGISFQRDIQDKSTRRFLELVICLIAYVVTILVSEILDGKSTYSTLLYALNLMIYFWIDVIVCQFMRYMYSLVEDYENKKVRLISVVYIASITRVIVIIMLMMTGNLFSIVDGHYVEQELSDVPYIMTGIIMLLPITFIILNKECFTRRQFIVVLLYILFPVLPVVIEMFTGIYTLSPLAMTISVLMVYILIQDSNLETSKTKQAILEELSSTDLLTELNNRRAYYTCINSIHTSDTVGVVFCDLNGLKYTNDHFGHTAGDVLIKKFANLLTECFRKDEVFRISGDEFVAILPGIDEDVLKKRVASLERAIDKNNQIASYGCAYGNGSRIEHLISEAETKMYENKREYYAKKS